MPEVANPPIEPPLTEIEVERCRALERHVEMLAGVIGVRHDSRPSSLDASVSYITREWEAMGETVREEPYRTAAWEAKNLVVEWPGRDPKAPVVVLGAHYDTVRTTPGADDNASAVAVLLEATRMLTGRRFRRTVRFVAFANEEPPHFGTRTMGSRVYAEACRARGDAVHAMVCLEMVGYFDCRRGKQSYPDELPRVVRPLVRDTGDFISVVSDVRSCRVLRRFRRGFRRASSLPMIAAPVPRARELLWLSDHGPFWDLGYPAMMVTDTSWFRNPHYHEMTDTPATLDYERMTRVLTGVVGGVAALASR
ncbi:MAG: M20/M25/M40 family metallo-hydrolase [Planctomycetota bacterium]